MNMFSFSKLYESIAFPLAGLLFIIYIFIVYYSRERYNSYSNKTYRIILFITMLAALSFILFCFSADNVLPSILKPVFARIYVLMMMLWGSLFAFYNIITFMLKDNDVKKIKMLKIIILSLTLLIFIASCFVNLEYEHGSMYAMGGSCLYFLYAIFAFSIIIYIICPIFYHKRMSSAQLSMHLVALAVIIILTLLRFLFNVDINYFTFVVCVFPITLYFGSESQAYLLSKKLESSIKVANENNEIQHNIFKEKSKDIREPIDIICSSREIINSQNEYNDIVTNEKNTIKNNLQNILNTLNELSNNNESGEE